MKNVYYPLAGMNYIIDDLAEIIKNKMDGKKDEFYKGLKEFRDFLPL